MAALGHLYQTIRLFCYTNRLLILMTDYTFVLLSWDRKFADNFFMVPLINALLIRTAGGQLTRRSRRAARTRTAKASVVPLAWPFSKSPSIWPI